MSECDCCKRTKQRSEEEHNALLNRLSRIEGQIRGIRRMVEEDAYCVDILTQSSAALSALDAFNKELLTSHFRSCVVRDIKDDDEAAIEEFEKVLKRMMR